MYTVESIQKIRDVDITTVVAHYIQLDKHNKACCPIHNESSPSFTVTPKKNIFKCFGCGAGGDGIRFVQLVDRVDFMEAVERIAAIATVALEEERVWTPEDRDKHQKAREERKSMLQLLMEAHELYKEALSENDTVLSLLTNGRQWERDLIKEWGIGFAPDYSRTLSDKYSNSGLLPVAAAAGLVRDKESRHYDVYRNRIIFPIHNERGDLISFGGRIVKDEDKKYGKYINGHAGPLYDKSAVLFGLHKAEKSIRETGHAILVEGYADVISMHRANATNTVATCGTALTDMQARLLKKYTDKIMIIRDGDSAGQKATEKDINLLLKHSFQLDVLPLEEGMDPDDLARQFFDESQPITEEE